MGKNNPNTISSPDPDNLSINTMRFLSIDAIQNAKSGHPGLPMGACAYGYVLWPRILHSNGQFHQGGPDTGLFLQISATDPQDLSISDAPYSFGTKKRADPGRSGSGEETWAAGGTG